MEDNLQKPPQSNKYVKYLIVVVSTVFFILIVLVLIIKFPRNKVPGDNNEVIPTITKTPISQNMPNPKSWLEPISSVNRELNLRYRIEEMEDKYKIDIILRGYKSRLVVEEDGEGLESGVIWSTEDYKEQLDAYLITKRNTFAWSPSDNRFALLTPDKILVYNFVSNPVPNDTWSPPRVNVALTKTNEFLIDGNIDKFDTRSILFSGDGKELYYSSNDGIRMLFPEEKTFNTQVGYYPQEIYQIPSSTGIAYWISDNEVFDNNKHSFILDYGRSFEKHTLISSFGIDYPGEILLSPNIDKVCIGWGSSGSKGRLLFNLTNGKQIDKGAGCLEWIDNNRIVLYETDSPGGGENGYLKYYLFNLITKEKTFLHDYYTGI
jgi:hypothetical protein